MVDVPETIFFGHKRNLAFVCSVGETGRVRPACRLSRHNVAHRRPAPSSDIRRLVAGNVDCLAVGADAHRRGLACLFLQHLVLSAAPPWNGEITGGAYERLRLYLATSVRFLRKYWLLYIVTLVVVLALNASCEQSNDRSRRFAFALAASAFIAGLTMLPVALLGWVKAWRRNQQLGLYAATFAVGRGHRRLAFLVAAKDAGAQWHFVAQSVVCASLLVFIATLRPGGKILHYPFEVSQAPLATAYEQSKGGDYWFPEFPFSSLLATGRPYHHSYAIYALYLAGRPVSLQQLSEGIPRAPFKLKYLIGNPEGSRADTMITLIKVPPDAGTEEQIGPWRQLLVKNWPAF